MSGSQPSRISHIFSQWWIKFKMNAFLATAQAIGAYFESYRERNKNKLEFDYRTYLSPLS